jgi:hypothetical protein
MVDVLLDAPTPYHFALGQKLVNDPAYMYAYRRLAARGHHIIVDNGAAEPAVERVPFPTILRAVADCGALEVVMPDVLEDASATIEMTCDRAVLDLVPVDYRMIVPQGRNLIEWTACLMEMHRRLKGRYASIGVPKHLEAKTGGRAEAVDFIVGAGLHLAYPIHLLGAHKDILAEARACALYCPTIRGIDSGVAVAYAQRGMQFPVRASRVDRKKPSLEWFGTADHQLALANVVAVINNLA